MDHLKTLSDRPMFLPDTRRYIPMRHEALAFQLGGDVHPGLPTGIYIEVVGGEHSGKSTLMSALADAVINQPKDAKQMVSTEKGLVEVPAPRKVLYVDYENTLDPLYVSRSVRDCEFLRTDDSGKPLNLKTANFLVARPDLLHEGVDAIIAMIQSGEIGLAVVDSLPAMLPKEEHEKSAGESTVGLLARETGKFLRKTTHLLRRHGCTIVIINQWRSKIGVSFGDPRTTPGGAAPGYFDSIKLDCMGAKFTPWFPDAGKTVKIKAMKNKVSGYKTEAVYHLSNEIGLSAEVELTEGLLKTGHVTNRGPNSPVTLHYNGQERTFAHRNEWLKMLRDNAAIFERLRALARENGWKPGEVIAKGNMPE